MFWHSLNQWTSEGGWESLFKETVRHKNMSQTAWSEDDLAQSQLRNQAARPMNLIRFLASAAPPAAQVGRAAAAYGRAGEIEALPFQQVCAQCAEKRFSPQPPAKHDTRDSLICCVIGSRN